MIQDTEPTNVSFYLATYEPREADEQPYREVLAVFVDEEENSRYGYKCFSCYAHLGQHSTCSQSFLAQKCKKITEKEQYQELFNELESIGYKLNVV
jgi:peptide subunit release factor 1 (eRF1)